MNYYRRYCGDYMRDTQDLSPLQHGFYSVLLDIYYSTEKPLPADIEAIARMCRVTNRSQKRSLSETLTRFFPLNGDGLRHNKRADEEILKAQAAISKMSESGKDGARRRWDREPHSPPHRVVDGVPMQPPAFKEKALDVESPTRVGQPHLKNIPQADSDPAAVERHLRIAQAVAKGDTALAQRIRDGL